MKDEKQIIEEMAKDVAHSISWCDEVIPEVDCLATAEALYGMGYCKQSEGEWKVTRTAKRIYIKCTRCNYTKLFDRLESITDERKYIIKDFIDTLLPQEKTK